MVIKISVSEGFVLIKVVECEDKDFPIKGACLVVFIKCLTTTLAFFTLTFTSVTITKTL